uniref:RING-CH-type domain-containing protein n=1 Tax=Caenorhabditis tropicalis TaxID=1561998 RepID=A0A1I7U3U2_9PELO
MTQNGETHHIFVSAAPPPPVPDSSTVGQPGRLEKEPLIDEDGKDMIDESRTTYWKGCEFLKASGLCSSKLSLQSASANMCRICHTSSSTRSNPLISPCRCSGTLLFVHKACVVRWLEMSTRKMVPSPRCELCGYDYRRGNIFQMKSLHVPHVDRTSLLLNVVFLVTVFIMIFCGYFTIQFIQENALLKRRLIAKFNSCVRDYRSTCPRHVTISLIDSSYGYLCNEGYNTFMESAECLMELDRKPSVKRCHDETLKEIESANTESGVSMPAKVDRMCGALNFFSGCVRSPIKQDCGFSAWQVIYRVLKDTTNTLMPACQFTGTSQKLASFQKETNSTSVIPTTSSTVIPSTRISTVSRTTRSPIIETTTRVTVDLEAEDLGEVDEEFEEKQNQKKQMRKIHSSELTDASNRISFSFSFLVFGLFLILY